MLLREFVGEALLEIVLGIKGAQADVARAGGCINPLDVQIANSAANAQFDFKTRSYVVMVEMEVSVKIKEEAGKKGELRVVAGLISAGGQLASGSTGEAASRIHFSVPLRLPPGSPEPEDRLAELRQLVPATSRHSFHRPSEPGSGVIEVPPRPAVP